MSSKPIRILTLLALSGCIATATTGGGAGTSDGNDTVQAEPVEGDDTTTTVVAEPVDDPAEPAATGPTAQDPIECAGQEQITLDGVTITNDDGAGIRASGNCQVTLTNSEVSGSTYGVDASGNAQVTIQAGRVSGGEAAVVSVGNAQVNLPETEVQGEVRVQGNGQADGAAAGGMGMSEMGMSSMGMSAGMGMGMGG